MRTPILCLTPSPHQPPLPTPTRAPPTTDVDEVELVEAPIIHHNEALRLRARRQCVDSSGTARNAGEEWLVREPGAYCALVDEIVLEKRRAAILTDKKALHMRASTTFTDVYDQKHRAGDEWLVTSDMTGSHITDVHEEVVGEVSLTTLTNRQFVVIVDPYVEGVQRLGSVELRKGEASFFLKPGESMRDGIEDVVVLNDDEALLLTAVERFMDPDGDSAAPGFGGGVTAAGGGGEVDSDSSIVDIGDIKGLGLPETTASKAVRNSSSASVSGPVERRPGDVWCVYGPRDYIPPVEVEVIERRKAIALDENEGIYVRDKTTGKVRAVIGETYMLRPSEELFEKELTDEVEALLERQRLGQAYIVPGDDGTIGALSAEASARDRTRVVSFRVPFGAACQVYDYGKRKERVIFGPNLVMLGPEEQLSVIRLSGGTPKKPNCIRTLTLMLGPDFATDVLHVETADHARLQLTLSYNWHFDVAADETDPKRRNAPFAVRDFVGDMTKSIASRVRGAVASETFDAFHKHSTRILRASVFGLDESGSVRDELRFEQNSLVVTSLDVKAVEPVDDRTRESLQKSVQLAIEITTKSQEARAQHVANREEEEAKGHLLRQKLKNEAESEAARKSLLLLQAESAAVETQGHATAEAKALAEAARIKGEADVRQAELHAQAMRIERAAALEARLAEQEADLAHKKALIDLEVSRETKMAQIEAEKFKATIDAIGASTIEAMARAGPEMQAKLLSGLGLQGYLITDGKSPINLFQTAGGMIATPGSASGAAAAGAGAGAGSFTGTTPTVAEAE